MAEQDRIKWNHKYESKLAKTVQPSPPNKRLALLMPVLTNGLKSNCKGEALDLACGLGGNSLYLARQGFRVTALDISDVAINCLAKLAEEEQLPIDGRVVDLEEIKLPPAQYDLVIKTYYLQRDLFEQVKRTLKPSGLVFVETFLQTEHDANPHIRPAYKLQPQELLSVFEGWHVLYYYEQEKEGLVTMLARKPSR
ncbi:SAM-dependent methyltransferase [Caldalkalibacillus thermarum]|uniref:class I SAM-dependent methyltransferase n=1 Tax=Caldalkalibacillus thermarum TaxID=296745 RepID=UPI001663588D|nr:methyltransferase domain-containing protein [Caldalkalibacillus thermarum]GGK24477.1 SAM-dependent methyltransferase [Caldalkalibacillus thermarum]